MSSPIYDYLIVGAGFSGATLANKIATELNKTVLVIDKRDHIGGNCYDYIDKDTDILVSKYGAHIFHTNDKEVWDYVNSFSSWTRYDHKVLAEVLTTDSLTDGLTDGLTPTKKKYVPIPVNQDTINSLFNISLSGVDEVNSWLKEKQIVDKEPINSEDIALQRVGKELYELLFKSYTIKQWGKEPSELDTSVLARIPVRNNNDGRYFSDKFQGLPSFGYTKLFEKMLSHPNITVRIGTSWEEQKDNINYKTLIFTGRIDQYFSTLGFEKLEYRSLDFHVERKYNIGYFQRNGVVNYPSIENPYTRSVEYKWFPNEYPISPHSVVVFETSCEASSTAEPYYPVHSPANLLLFEKYKSLAQKEKNVHFIGRLANYRYFNMDEAIRASLDYFNEHFIY